MMQLEQSFLEESDLLAAKLKCLELANAMWRTPENTPITADLIVSDAQKFWDFLTADITVGESQSETDA